jgi:hypothetical protein
MTPLCLTLAMIASSICYSRVILILDPLHRRNMREKVSSRKLISLVLIRLKVLLVETYIIYAYVQQNIRVYLYSLYICTHDGINHAYISTSVLGTGTMNNKSVQQDDGQQLHQRPKDRKAAASTNSSSSFEFQYQQEARPITTDSNNQQLMSQVLDMQRKLELLSETNSRLRQELEGQQRTTINDDFYQRKRNFGSMQESSSGAEPKLQQQYYYRGDSESTVNDDQMHSNDDVHSHHEYNRKDRRFRYYYGGTTRR